MWGGHQRLEQLDALEKNQDYDLTVCVIDVDEREEAELNVQLNNLNIQGEWDLDKLGELSKTYDLDLVNDLLFTKVDVDFMFEGNDRFSELYNTDEVKETKEKLNEIKKDRSEMNDRLKKENSINWYTVIVFENEEARAKFMREISVPVYEQYITAEQVRRISATNI